MSVRLAVMGATGLVGRMIRRVLEEREFPCSSIKFLSSARTAGQKLEFRGEAFAFEEAKAGAFKDVDIVLSSTPGSVSKQLSPQAAAEGAVVIDNSSAYRMDPNVPLVVPEVNPGAISTHRGIIANPNCSTIQMMVALKPLHDLARIKRVVAATYQASSGKGHAALEEFQSQLVALGRGEPFAPVQQHRHRLAGNCLPDDWTMGEDGYTEEEWKVMRETRKILGDDSIAVTVTCVRVPVATGHSEAVNLEFHDPITVEQARKALSSAPGIIVQDDWSARSTPLAADVEGRDETFVGRIRKDPTVPNGINLWIVADNLRKGAATNAVQIAEYLVKHGMVGKK